MSTHSPCRGESFNCFAAVSADGASAARQNGEARSEAATMRSSCRMHASSPRARACGNNLSRPLRPLLDFDIDHDRIAVPELLDVDGLGRRTGARAEHDLRLAGQLQPLAR